jgi:hypothetical protein
MPLLKSITDLKPAVYELEKEAGRTMPDEIRDSVVQSIREIRDAVNKTASLIEKHYRDEELLANMKKNLERDMKKEPIYDGLTREMKDAVMESVIGDPEINLINEGEFKEFVLDQLKTGTPEILIKTAYSKNSIIELGDAVAARGAGQNDKYAAGMGVLSDMVKTPTGREDALSQGVARALSDPTIRRHYLNLYYGLLPGKAGGEEQAEKKEEPEAEAGEKAPGGTGGPAEEEEEI